MSSFPPQPDTVHAAAPLPGLQLLGAARWTGAESGELPDALPGWLVAVLALRGDWLGRDLLASLLWPERTNADALRNLRANLHRLRQLLQPLGLASRLQVETRRVRLQLPTDVATFRAALGAGDWLAAAAAPAGPLWPAATCRGFPALEAWMGDERQSLLDAWRRGALLAARQLAQDGDEGRAAALLLQWLERTDEPAEDVLQALLSLAPAAGCRAEARHAAERLIRRLRDDADAGPEPRTRALLQALDSGTTTFAERAVATETAPVALPPGLRVPPRMVGRVALRAQVADLQRPLVVVAGEPGVGKTRLLHEALPEATWIECREALREVPFGPLIDWLSDQSDTLAADADERRVLARLLPAWADGEQLPPPDPLHARSELVATLAALLARRGRPIVLDDAQWADAASAELMLTLAAAPAPPLRVAYRANEMEDPLRQWLAALAQRRCTDTLNVEPLAPAELSQLLATLSHSDAVPGTFAAWLHGHSGGNPFFALQTLRLLFESGRLVTGPAGWSSALDDLNAEYAELQVPPAAAGLVLRRVQALGPSARRVLGMAAVAGDARAEDAIACALGLDPPEMQAALAELHAAGLLRGARFVHDLVRQGVLQAQPPALRQWLHAAVARHLGASLHGAQRVAHWWQAGAAEAALAACDAVSTSLCQRGLHADALRLVDDALARPIAPRQRAALLARRARIRLEQAEPDAAEVDLQALLALQPPPAERAEGLLVQVALRLEQGRAAEAGQLCDAVQALVPGHPRLAAERARVAHLQGRVAEVVVALEERVEALRRRPVDVELLDALCGLGAAYDELGQVQRGLPLLQEAYALGGRIGARYAQVQAAVSLLWNLSAQQRDEEGVAIAEQALALGEYDSTPTLRNNLSWSLRQLGRVDEAARLCEQLMAGRDPTLALVAHSRLVEIRAEDPAHAAGVPARVEDLLEACAATDVYLAHAAAVRVVARLGSDAQLRRALVLLRPQAALDPWLHQSVAEALRARGLDAEQLLGAAAGS